MKKRNKRWMQWLFLTLRFVVLASMFVCVLRAESVVIRVVDAYDGAEIPYASIFLDSRYAGFVVDSHGVREFDFSNLKSDISLSLICNAFGYESCKIHLDKTIADPDTLLIRMNPAPVALSELTVFPKNGKKKKTRVIGKKNNHGIFNCVYEDIDSINSIVDFTTGFEVKTKEGFSELSKFGFYIMQHERMLSEMKFRITVYDMSEVESAPTDKFKVAACPIYVDYSKDKVNKNKFVYEFPNPILLPKKAMVEIEFMSPMGDEFILTKGNGLGKYVWSRMNSEYWDKDPFVRPFFIEVNTYH